jgi:hypothetical protein
MLQRLSFLIHTLSDPEKTCTDWILFISCDIIFTSLYPVLKNVQTYKLAIFNVHLTQNNIPQAGKKKKQKKKNHKENIQKLVEGKGTILCHLHTSTVHRTLTH